MKTRTIKNKNMGIVVIGGGPAGLIAAITAARAGQRVSILEKNRELGKKLRITGGGRCNITNNTSPIRSLLSVYQEAGKFLFSPFAQFDVPKTREWFREIGVDTVEEAERRVFPVSQSAVAVTEALIAEAKRVGVQIATCTTVTGIQKDTEHFVVTTDTDSYEATAVIVTTGGLSRPETGSTGDGFVWLTALGHSVVTPEAALVPIATTNRPLAKKLAGVSLTEAGIKLMLDDVLVEKRVGKVLFTHVGLSGPGILNISQKVGAFLTEGMVTIALDLLPTLPQDELEHMLKANLIDHPNKQIQNQWQGIIPTALVVPMLAAAGVEPTTQSHSITVPMRKAIVAAIKHLPFRVSHLLGTDKAVVTSGGVALTEIDFRTMESRLVPGLYVAGDILNINRPSGGYSLQLAWTTGYVAGLHAGNDERD